MTMTTLNSTNLEDLSKEELIKIVGEQSNYIREQIDKIKELNDKIDKYKKKIVEIRNNLLDDFIAKFVNEKGLYDD